MGKQYRASATVYWAKPPSMSYPVNLARGHRFSRPEVQYRQEPHVQPSHATPTLSPTARPPGHDGEDIHGSDDPLELLGGGAKLLSDGLDRRVDIGELRRCWSNRP